MPSYYSLAHEVPCRRCGAVVGACCRSRSGLAVEYHAVRQRDRETSVDNVNARPILRDVQIPDVDDVNARMVVVSNTMSKKKPKKSDALDKRYMIRCADEQWELWDALATHRGYNGAGPLIRKQMTDLIESLPKDERKKLDEIIAAKRKAAA